MPGLVSFLPSDNSLTSSDASQARQPRRLVFEREYTR